MDRPTDITVKVSVLLDVTLTASVLDIPLAELRLRGILGDVQGDEGRPNSSQRGPDTLSGMLTLPVTLYALALRAQLAVLGAAFGWMQGGWPGGEGVRNWPDLNGTGR